MGEMVMNGVDYIVVAVVVFSGGMAVLRGFLREIVGLVGWGLAFVMASRFSGGLATYLAHWIPQPGLLHPLSFFLVFTSTLIFFSVLGRLLKHLAGQVGLSVTDRFLGLCFGLVRGLLILMIGVVLVRYFYQEVDAAPLAMLDESFSYPYLVQGVEWITQQLPPDWVLTRETLTELPATLEVPAIMEMDLEQVLPSVPTP